MITTGRRRAHRRGRGRGSLQPMPLFPERPYTTCGPRDQPVRSLLGLGAQAVVLARLLARVVNGAGEVASAHARARHRRVPFQWFLSGGPASLPLSTNTGGQVLLRHRPRSISRLLANRSFPCKAVVPGPRSPGHAVCLNQMRPASAASINPGINLRTAREKSDDLARLELMPEQARGRCAVDLITRRSRVRIPPPLLAKGPRKRALGVPRPREIRAFHNPRRLGSASILSRISSATASVFGRGAPY